MNIVVAKFGQSINFDRKKIKSNLGGNIDVNLFLVNLFRNSPQHNFYIIQRNNFSQLDTATKNYVNVNDNVIDTYEGLQKQNYKKPYNFMIENNIKIDCGLIFNGMAFRYFNVPNTVENKKGQVYGLLEMWKHYTGNLSYFLNKTNVPYISIVMDPKYGAIVGRDIMNLPKYQLSTFNGEFNTKRWTNYNVDSYQKITDLIFYETKLKTTYNAMENIVLLEYDKRKDFLEKTTDITYVLNMNAPWDRLSQLKPYLTKDSKVYGKWDEETMKDERFMGNVPYDDLHDILKSTKYTLCIPIAKGWTTTKYLEMIMNDVIPFFHPAYDSQHNVDVPDILRVKSPQDYFEKIAFLNDNEEERKKLLTNLKEKLFKEEYINGVYFANILNEHFAKITNTQYTPLDKPIEHQETNIKQLSIFDF